MKNLIGQKLQYLYFYKDFEPVVITNAYSAKKGTWFGVNK